MKIAITGHTRGLGEYLYNNLPYECKGFSTTNGYDINEPHNILSEIDDCDILINNAYDNMAQVDLLFAWYRKYKDVDKTIINIGSRAATYARYRYKLHDYSIYKAALLDASMQLVNTERSCKICHYSFPYLGNNGITLNEACELIKIPIDNKGIEIVDFIMNKRDN